MSANGKFRDTNQVQTILAQAICIIDSMAMPEEEFARLQLLTLKYSLQLGEAYTASGNSIPALGGRGLEELLTVATEIIEGEYSFSHRRLNFKHLASAFLA